MWKEFAPRGSKFFPYRIDPFTEGAWHTVKQTRNHNSFLPWRKLKKHLSHVPHRLNYEPLIGKIKNLTGH